MTSMTNSVKVCICFEGLTSETNNFASEVKVKRGLESTCVNDEKAKIGLNVPKE